MKKLVLILSLIAISLNSNAQFTYPINSYYEFETDIMYTKFEKFGPPDYRKLVSAQKDSTYMYYWIPNFGVYGLRNSLNQSLSTTHTVLTANDSGMFKVLSLDSLLLSWNNITSKPSLFSGSYSDLSGKPSLFSGAYSDLTGKPSLFSGSYTDLTNKPTIPTNTNQLTNGAGFITSYTETDPQFNTNFAAKTTDGLTQGSTNKYFSNSLSRLSLSAGTGVSYDNSTGVITNSNPDQTVSLTGSNGITASGTYPNFTITKSKRQETYSGTTNSSGIYTVTYGTAYGAAPNVQFQINGGTNKQTILLTSSTTIGFTCYVQARTDIVGLLPSYANVNGAAVDVLVTEK